MCSQASDISDAGAMPVLMAVHGEAVSYSDPQGSPLAITAVPGPISETETEVEGTILQSREWVVSRDDVPVFSARASIVYGDVSWRYDHVVSEFEDYLTIMTSRRVVSHLGATGYRRSQ